MFTGEVGTGSMREMEAGSAPDDTAIEPSGPSPAATVLAAVSPRAPKDHWGRSEPVRRVVRHLFEPSYRWWFRCQIDGAGRIPADRGALLVANHAGAVPVDGALLLHGLEAALDRPVYALHHHGLRAVPFLGTFLARNGGVVAHPDNAQRLLRDEGALVLVFPEGTKGTTKPFSQRYRLQRFGRNGFVETAMRAGVPIVPIAVVGTEEAMPALWRVPLDGSSAGWPITLNQLVLGPLGTVVHLPTKVRAEVLEPVHIDAAPDLDRYPPGDVADASEDVRRRLQGALDGLVARRRGVFRG
jgi:1-acyl-sn-glycerol-3-phosphate acyltransferase